ncbi:MAG: hypothetical protein ACKVJE_17235 [Pseudomonadales bacterium]
MVAVTHIQKPIKTVVDDIIKHFGGINNATQVFGYEHPQSLRHWKKTGVIPVAQCCMIQVMTDSKWRAVDLNPECVNQKSLAIKFSHAA